MSKKLTKEEWVIKARLIHGDRYDYSKVEYVNSSTKVTIVCLEHGEFKQLPFNHLNTKGCPKCGRETAVAKYIKLTKEEIYKTALKCCTRGEFRTKFNKEYAASINRGFYEEICSHMEIPYNKVKSAEEFKNVVEDLVGNEYEILSDYKNRITNVKFKHNECGGIYETTPASFLRGRRCPSCAGYGFNPNKPALLYYIKIILNDIEVYKIGITNNSIKSRYSLAELSIMETLFTKSFDIGLDAYKIEQKILKVFNQYKYAGPSILHRGNTELFNINIKELNEFKNIIQEK